MNKEYIVKHNLMEAHKQFMRLSEGPLYGLREAGDEEQPEGQNDTPPMNGGEQQAQPMNQGMMPQDAMQGQGGMGDQATQDQQMGDEMPPMDMGDQGGMEQPMPQDDGAGIDVGPDLDPNVDDSVLDVEDLTQAQEKLNKKQNELGHDLGDVDNRIMALLTAVEKIQGSIDKNNSDIESLKSELEKRVPTQTEKLNMQSLKMYPYNVSPNDYWDKKELDGRYQAQEDDKKPYKVTKEDVDDYSDNEIEKSFDDELHQTMKDIFKDF